MPLARRVLLAICSAFAALMLATPVHAQVYMEQAFMDSAKGRVQVSGYAMINYNNYKWDTDPNRRADVDMERAVIEASYRLTPKIELTGEVEFEHGGTGTTIEYDPFEEFGEFEHEIEKGGEIRIEELHVTFQLAKGLRLRVGHFYVPMGFLSSKYTPTEYLTVNRNDVEASLIPTQWDETGVKLMGHTRVVRYQLGVVNGLDNSEFSSGNWIRLGHQLKFETVRAENLAAIARVDIFPTKELMFGTSGYVGNSTGNRPKADFTEPAYVTVVDAHANYDRGPWHARGLFLYGHLQNSAAVSAANRNLSNALDAKRTPVAKAALGWSVEGAYDVLALFDTPRAPNGASAHRLDVFGMYQYYDSMHETAAGVFDNPRWERKQWIAGFNYRPHLQIVVKAQYAHRTLGLATANHENTVSTGIGVEF